MDLRNYLKQQIKKGVNLRNLTRHIVGLYKGQPGARKYRQILSGVIPENDLHFFEEVIEDRKKLNFDGKLIENKVSKIVVINSYLSLIKIYDAINEKKLEHSFNASKEYLSNMLMSIHL